MRTLQHTVLRLDNARYVGKSRPDSAITSIVMHCTGGDSADATVSWLNRIVGNGEGKASYHYIIPKAPGKILRTAPTDRIAFHAGYSHYPPVPNTWWTQWGSVNYSSVGISWANDNKADSNLDDDALTPWQLEAGLWLCVTLCKRFNIPPSRVFGHLEIAPKRKTDPHPEVMPMDKWRDLVSTHFN